MTVYVTQQPTPNRKGWQPDLSPAAQYGAIKYVFDADTPVSSNPNIAQELAVERLLDFNPDTDYICYPNSGDPTSYAMVSGTLAWLGYEQFTVLAWNRDRDAQGNPRRDRGYYTPVTIHNSQNNRRY